MMIDHSAAATQSLVGGIVGVTQQAISSMMLEGKLPQSGTVGELILAYCDRLREQAAGRMGEEGGLDLVQERAALARSQRISQDMKNDIARGDYAPIGMLADMLGLASSAVVDRFDQLDGALRKACPTLPDDAKATVMQVIASARNEWIRSTSKLVSDAIDAMDDDDSDDASEDQLAEVE
jgi:phage terminase Nu1 subunit (DNA packaging protein)